MSKKPKMLFLSRHDCHLCEQALALWENAKNSVLWKLEIVYIDENVKLLTTYKHKIPVFRQIGTTQEIAWPVTQESLNEFLTQ